MNNTFSYIFSLTRYIFLIFFLSGIYHHGAYAQKLRRDSITYSVFEKIRLFEPESATKPLILYFTGEQGWNDSERNIAVSLSGLGAPVAVINTRRLEQGLSQRKSACVYPAANLEELSKLLQKKLLKKSYQYPVLAGHGAGSAWVLAMIAQAPQNTFAGGIALGFCNQLYSRKPLCKGNGLVLTNNGNDSYTFRNTCRLPEPISIYLTASDISCHQGSVKELFRSYINVNMVEFQNLTAAFDKPGVWLPEVRKAYNSIIEKEDPFTAFLHASSKEAGLPADLPLTFHPAPPDESLPLCIMISGDGGWTGFDQSLALELSAHGIPVCGLNSLKYFWDKKDPATVAADVSAIARHYLVETHRKSLILLGYSFGADVLPFVYNKLPHELEKITRLVTLLSPSPLADFEIHYSDMLGVNSSGDRYDVFHEIRTIQRPRLLCIYGSDEESDMFHPYLQPNVNVTVMSGGHHYDNSFDKIRSDIFKNLENNN